MNDGRLVIGPSQLGAPRPPSGRREELVSRLHPAIRDVSLEYLERLNVAAFEAFKMVNGRVKEMTGLNADGSDLMGKAFVDKHAPLQLGDLSTDSGYNIQSGYRFLFMGALRALRNPGAHEPFESLTDEEALERLGLASLLMRRLDDASKRPEE